MPSYPGGVKCTLIDDGVSIVKSEWKGCTDGYYDSTTQSCVSNCGVGKYGSSTFDSTRSIIISECKTCSAPCVTCAGAGSSKCTSCAKNSYVDASATNGKPYGTCRTKSTSTSTAFTYYVQPPTTMNANYEAGTVQDITGTIDDSFNYLEDAIAKA